MSSRMHPYCATDIELENLIPSKGPDKKPGWAGEQAVYKFFRDYMPSDWDVFYDAHFDAADLPEHQLDFLVVIPNVGIINIDAKGGNYFEYDGKIWLGTPKKGGTQNGAPGTGAKAVDIYGKASSASKDINRYMMSEISAGMRWGHYSYLLLFALTPIVARDTEREAAFSLFGAYANKETSIEFARQLEEHILIKRLRYSPRAPVDFTANYRSQVIQRLSRRETPAAINMQFLKWDQISEQMLTQPQQIVFQRLLRNDCCHVKGAAGTGKSIIAIALAKRYAQQGKDVLYVCFNRALAEKLDRKIGSFPGRNHLAITNFDRIQTKFGRSSDYAEFHNNREGWDRYLEETLPNLANQKGRFDVLIVDEAQDLSQRELFILLSCLQENRKIVLFSDAEQTIFSYENKKGWNYDERALFPGEEVVELRLDMNYRNASTIHCAMQQYEDNQGIIPYWNEFTMDGAPLPVQHITFRDVRHKLSAVLGHASMNQIAFLTSRWNLLDPYRNWQDGQGHLIRFVGGNDGRQTWECLPEWERGNGILKASIQGFKGLDADIVFLFGMDQARVEDELKYVGLSRAKWELYVVE